eukprot:6479080-Amphidinium_carterae.1
MQGGQRSLFSELLLDRRMPGKGHPQTAQNWRKPATRCELHSIFTPPSRRCTHIHISIWAVYESYHVMYTRNVQPPRALTALIGIAMG